jgi:hypothetical protein
MGWFGDDHETAQCYDQYQNAPKHEASVTHELLSGAAAYEAAKEYEKHCEANGKPVNHAKAKELLAGFAGAFIDRELETKGLDFIDKEKAKRHARDRCEEVVTVEKFDNY